jgi:hypothetical protein
LPRCCPQWPEEKRCAAVCGEIYALRRPRRTGDPFACFIQMPLMTAAFFLRRESRHDKKQNWIGKISKTRGFIRSAA